MQFDFDLRIDVAQAVPRRFQFAAANVLCSVKDLPLQIRKIDIVEINNPNCAHTGRGQVQCSRRPQSPRADAQNAGRFQTSLSFLCNFGHHEMARIPLQFFTAQLHCVASFVVDDAGLHAVVLILAQFLLPVARDATGSERRSLACFSVCPEEPAELERECREAQRG